MKRLDRFMRHLRALLFFTATPVFSQVILVPNVNHNAKELKHYLSSAKDSLKLECKYPINMVTITGTGFKRTTNLVSHVKSIPLNQLPKGRNTVLVYTNNKIIVFNIIKN